MALSVVLVSLVPAWLRDNGVDLATIGLFALIGLPYTWKFLWSPVMDRFKLPFLGRRRGWALLTQVLLLISIGFLAVTGYMAYNLLKSYLKFESYDSVSVAWVNSLALPASKCAKFSPNSLRYIARGRHSTFSLNFLVAICKNQTSVLFQ